MDLTKSSTEQLRVEAERLYFVIEGVMLTNGWRENPKLVEDKRVAELSYSAVLKETEKRLADWWTCLNPMCKAKHPMGVYKCECGYTYTTVDLN